MKAKETIDPVATVVFGLTQVDEDWTTGVLSRSAVVSATNQPLKDSADRIRAVVKATQAVVATKRSKARREDFISVSSTLIEISQEKTVGLISKHGAGDNSVRTILSISR